MCAQLRKPNYKALAEVSALSDTPLGIPPSETQIGLQQDVVKELINKVAWTLGSVYRCNYSKIRTPARAYAWRIVKKVIEDNGYPDKIAK